jgi:hypothetical protein
MGKIFRRSWVTVVALGSNNSLPVPGVSNNRSIFSSPVPGNKGVIAISPETQFTSGVKKSDWNTRAWCFQEKLLVPRTIYCCENKMFVGCSKFVVPETQSLGEDPLKTSDFEQDIRPDFSSAVEDYSQRNLTNERDAVDAFRGYLAESDQQTYWALPIVASTPQLSHDDAKETGFCIGLLWYHQVTMNRSDAKKRAAQPRLSSKSDNIFFRGRGSHVDGMSSLSPVPRSQMVSCSVCTALQYLSRIR